MKNNSVYTGCQVFFKSLMWSKKGSYHFFPDRPGLLAFAARGRLTPCHYDNQNHWIATQNHSLPRIESLRYGAAMTGGHGDTAPTILATPACATFIYIAPIICVHLRPSADAFAVPSSPFQHLPPPS